MKRKIVIVAILILIMVFPTIYFTDHSASEDRAYHIDVNQISIGSAGMVVNSTNSSTFVNGTPPKIFISIFFHSNISKNVSWVYITTTEFTLQYWEYHNNTSQERFNTTKTHFCGTLPAGNASASISLSSIQAPYLTLCVTPNVYVYTGYISVHIVFSNIPGDAIY